MKLAVAPGRNGHQPQLSLQYNSSSGNSPYGLGWNLSPPNIQRQTDKGQPQYNDEDIFIHSGFQIKTAKRVSRIQIKSLESLVREYHLDYALEEEEEIDQASTGAIDLNGNGTPDLVWIQAAPEPPEERMQYLDFNGQVKANQLKVIDNGLGRRITLNYTFTTA